MNKEFNVKYFSLVCLAMMSCFENDCIAQLISNFFEIRGGAWTNCYESMVKDNSGNYYVGFNRNTWRPAVIGGSIIFSFRDENFKFKSLRFLLCEIQPRA
jgi:hypothetical protein